MRYCVQFGLLRAVMDSSLPCKITSDDNKIKLLSYDRDRAEADIY